MPRGRQPTGVASCFFDDAKRYAARLESRGFGPNKPVGTNDTGEGWSQSRRVQYRILQLGVRGSQGCRVELPHEVHYRAFSHVPEGGPARLRERCHHRPN